MSLVETKETLVYFKKDTIDEEDFPMKVLVMPSTKGKISGNNELSGCGVNGTFNDDSEWTVFKTVKHIIQVVDIFVTIGKTRNRWQSP